MSESKTLPMDAKGRPNVCVLCSQNCGIEVDIERGKIAKVRPDKKNPITKGYMCNKGFSMPHYAHHDQRLTHPLRKREDGTFEQIDWDTAIAEIGERLNQARSHSPRSIGFVGIGGQANHAGAPFALGLMEALGTKYWFNAFAQEKTQHFMVDRWMFDAPPEVWLHPHAEESELLLIVGTNPKVSNRGHNFKDTLNEMVRDPERTVIVVDPRETETTGVADHHVRLAPGSDAWLFLGIAAHIAATPELQDKAFIESTTIDFDVVADALSAVDLDEMAERCGVPADEIRDVATQFATAGSASIMYDLAIEQIPFLTLISYLFRVIGVLTGNFGRPGGHVFEELVSPAQWPEDRFDEPVRTVTSKIRGIPAMVGNAMFSPSMVPEEVLSDDPERMRAIICEGANPLLTFSDSNAWREACDELDLLVVIETAMTETAQLADYVLPASSGFEKWELCGFAKGYPEIFFHLRQPVLNPLGESLPECEIYSRIVRASGAINEPPAEVMELGSVATTPEGAAALFTKAMESASGQAELVFWAYEAMTPHLDSPGLVAPWIYAVLNGLQRRDGVVREFGEEWASAGPFELAMEVYRRMVESPHGVAIGRSGSPRENFEEFLHYEDKKVRLAPEALIAELKRAVECSPRRDGQYPFVLASGLRTPWTANVIHRDPKWRKGKGPHCTVHLSASDATGIGVETGDRVVLSTRRGSVELPAEIDRGVQDGHVWVPNGFGVSYPSGPNGEMELQGVNLNELADAADRDPITGIPHHKYTLCNIERVATTD